MATQDKVRQARQLCDDITQAPVEELVANAKWGTINFDGARENLELVFTIAGMLKNLPIELLPDRELNELYAPLTAFPGHVNQIKQFSIESGNPAGNRDQIVNAIANQTRSVYEIAQLRIPFLALQQGNFHVKEERLTAALAQADAALTEAQRFAATKKLEMDQILSAAQKASASVGVAHHTGDFSAAADTSAWSAKLWLAATASFGAVTLIAAVLFPKLYPVTNAFSGLQTIQVYTSKLLALGTLLTATVWCGRIYKAAKHQEMVNRHRANALKTFQTFVEGTKDEQTRNAVLLETTRSIFALTDTGYLDGGADGPDGGLKILEIIKSVGGGKSQ